MEKGNLINVDNLFSLAGAESSGGSSRLQIPVRPENPQMDHPTLLTIQGKTLCKILIFPPVCYLITGCATEQG